MIGGLWTSDEDFDVRATTMNPRKGFEKHGGRFDEDSSSTDEEESKEAGAENVKNSEHLVSIRNALKNNINAQTKQKAHTLELHADTVAFDNSTANIEAKNEDFSKGVHVFTKAPSIISFAEEAASENDAASTLTHEQEDAEMKEPGSRRCWEYMYNSSLKNPLISKSPHDAPTALSEMKITDEEDRIWAPIGEMSRLIRFKRDGTIEVHVENRYGGQREQKQSHTSDAQLASRLAGARRSIEELEEDVDEPLRIIREQDEYQQKLLAKIRARLNVRRSPSMSDATKSDGLQEKEAGEEESASEIKGTSRPRPSHVDLASRSAEVAIVNKPQRAKERVLLFADWLARADADADADADTNTDAVTDTGSQTDANVDLDQKRGTKSSEDEEDKAMKRFEPEAEVEVLRAQVERLRAKLRSRALELRARPFNNGETVDELLSDAQRFGLRALQRSRRASA